MLTKLTPEQISKFWDVISYAVEESLPPITGEHPDRMNRILSSALSGKVDVWASYNKSEDVNKFEGIVLTQILYDNVSNTRNLLIYCIYGYSNVDSKSWSEGLETLLKYAKGERCNQIVAYTDLPNIVNLVNRLDGEAKYTFLSFNVNKLIKKFNNLKET